jgi:hypothetical protein
MPADGHRDCRGSERLRSCGVPQVVSKHIGLLSSERMRLYLLDLPGGSARILAIAIIAEEPDSFEFHAP